MPGMSFVYDPRRSVYRGRDSIEQRLADVRYTPHYDVSILKEEDSWCLASCAYEAYPLECLKGDNVDIYIEGVIHSRTATEITTELTRLAEAFFSDDDTAFERAANWLAVTDGRFFICIARKDGQELLFMNDVFSRLPVYSFRKNGLFVLSRDYRFVAGLSGKPSPDRMGVAQFLMFGYPLGRRTLMEGVCRVDSADVTHIRLSTDCVTSRTVHQFNFDHKKQAGKSVQQAAKELSSLFVDACERVCSDGKESLLLLSGGLDSRAVAAGLCKAGVSFSALTYVKPDRHEEHEAEVAEQMARELNFGWQRADLSAVSGVDLLNMLRIKSGLNPFSVSHMLVLLDRIYDERGPNVRLLTGNGGDKILPRIAPLRPVGNARALLRYITENNSVFSVEETARLTGLRRRDILDEISARLVTYPEDDPSQKYTHFLIYERARKWLSEGEDRSRTRFRVTSPFYCLDVFDYAMNLPDDMKSNYSLYQAFLDNLSPKTLTIANANWTASIGSPRAKLRLLAMACYKRLPFRLRRLVRWAVKPGPGRQQPEALVQCLQQHAASQSVSDVLSLDDSIRQINSYSYVKALSLLTLTSAIESLSNGRCSLEQFRDSSFA